MTQINPNPEPELPISNYHLNPLLLSAKMPELCITQHTKKENMTQKYDINSLIETFEKHHEEVIINRKRMNIEFQKNYPGEPLPDYMQNDFSISKALCEICKAIKDLQESLDKVWDHIYGVED